MIYAVQGREECRFVHWWEPTATTQAWWPDMGAITSGQDSAIHLNRRDKWRRRVDVLVWKRSKMSHFWLTGPTITEQMRRLMTEHRNRRVHIPFMMKSPQMNCIQRWRLFQHNIDIRDSHLSSRPLTWMTEHSQQDADNCICIPITCNPSWANGHLIKVTISNLLLFLALSSALHNYACRLRYSALLKRLSK